VSRRSRAFDSADAAAAALTDATKDWKAAKKAERAARDRLAALVTEAVHAGLLSESRAARVTAIPRMTIRKMLGKE